MNNPPAPSQSLFTDGWSFDHINARSGAAMPLCTQAVTQLAVRCYSNARMQAVVQRACTRRAGNCEPLEARSSAPRPPGWAHGHDEVAIEVHRIFGRRRAETLRFCFQRPVAGASLLPEKMVRVARPASDVLAFGRGELLPSRRGASLRCNRIRILRVQARAPSVAASEAVAATK